MPNKKSENKLSKLKEIASMDIKDVVNLLKGKDKDNDTLSKKKSKKRKEKKKAKLVLSIDMGSNTIKLVEGKYEKNRLVIYKTIELPTPKDAILDGRIIDEVAIEGSISVAIKENRVKAKNVIFTTNSSSIINREILIPDVDEEDMEAVIKYEIQQYLPINLDDYIIQFLVVGEEISDEGKKIRVNVTTYPEKMALIYYNIIRTLKLKPYALDVFYNSMNKLANYLCFTKIDNEVKGTVAFVDIGASSINIAIFKNGKLDFTRMIKNGGDNINYAISENSDMSIKSIESLKIKEADLLNYEDELNEIVRKAVDEIIDEIERIMQFYKNSRFSNNIDKIYLYGGTSKLKNMDKYMEGRIDIPLNKIEILSKLKVGSKDVDLESIGKYLNAIGAIIRL